MSDAIPTGTPVTVATLNGDEPGRIFDTHTDGTDRWYRIHFDDRTFLTVHSSTVTVTQEDS